MVARLLALFALLLPVSVAAQTIHGHPQKAAYASPAEWPFLSAQCHWKVNGVVAHTHVEITAPIYAEWGSGKLTVPIRFVLFHTAGKITTVWSQMGSIQFTSISPANPTYPNILGDPNGVVVVHAMLHINPAKSATNVSAGPTWWNPHGWTSVQLSARTAFPDGSSTDTSVSIPFFSVANTTKVITVPGENTSLMVRSQCSPHSVKDSLSNAWGAMISDFKQYIPVGPLQLGEVLTPTANAYSYGATPALQSGTRDRRLNPDLHNGFAGIQVTSPVTFDSNFSGIGTHHFSFIWDKTIGDSPPVGIGANQQGTALLVVRVLVGEGGEPPPPPPPPPTPVEALLARLLDVRAAVPFIGTLTFTQAELDLLIAGLQ